MGIINPNKKAVRLRVEDRDYDEDGGWWEGAMYYDSYGGHYDEEGMYDDGCEERVREYEKEMIQRTRKRVGGKKIWKKMSWSARLECLVNFFNFLFFDLQHIFGLCWMNFSLIFYIHISFQMEDHPSTSQVGGAEKEEENVMVVKGSFGIVYSSHLVKEEGEKKKEEAWTWTEEDEKMIEKLKKESYKKGNRQ
jgi:hypothetical protein